MQTRYRHDKDHQNATMAYVPSGRFIAAIRTLLGISAEALAASAQISPYSLSRLERDRRAVTVGEMSRLIVALGGLMESKQNLA
jgi:hypothetical protein